MSLDDFGIELAEGQNIVFNGEITKTDLNVKDGDKFVVKIVDEVVSFIKVNNFNED
jgi:hypothetical protein